MALYTGFSGVAQFAQAVTLNPSAVPAASFATETFTVNGLKESMIVLVGAPSLETGLFLLDAQVTAADTLTLYFYNPTVAEINPASQSFNIIGL